MKNKEEKKNRIWVPIVIGALACSAAVGTGIALVHNQQRPKAGTVATMSDAADFSGLTTEAIEVTTEVTTEEATTEAALEVVSNESKKPEAVPATTEIGGGKKKAEETTEEKKPSTTESTKPSTNHSNNSGSASSGQSTAPKPSNSGSNSVGNSGNSSSGNSGSSNSAPSPKPSTPVTTEAPATTEAPKPSTTEAPTTQHQHVYDQEVIETPAKSIYHPEEGYYAPAMQCHGCHEIFTSSEAYFSHPCGDDYGYSSTHVWVKTKDEYTETIPAETHRECKCGARE